MGRASARASGALLALMLAAQLTGCESVGRYFRDRGRDATDIIDVKYGLGGGVGAKVEVTPLFGTGVGFGTCVRGREKWGREKWGREWEDFEGPVVQLGIVGFEGFEGHWFAETSVLVFNLPPPDVLDENPHHFTRFGADLFLPGGIFGAYLNVGEFFDFFLGIFGVDFVGDDEASVPPKPFSDESVPVYVPPVDADGVFFVIDHSGTVIWDGTLEYVRRAVPQLLEELPADGQFGIIYFGQRLLEFRSGEPAPADETTKGCAILFVEAVGQGSGSCPEDALHAALDLVEASDVESKAIVYIGDGGGTCRGAREDEYLERTLASVTDRNAGRAKIITIQVGDTGRIQESFLHRLASDNGGRHHRVVAPERRDRR